MLKMKTVDHRPNDKGFSAIGMVLVILLISSTLLYGLNQSSLSWQKAVINKKQHLYHFNQAISSLNWSLSQQWLVPTIDWQCRIEQALNLYACIKKSALVHGDFALVKAQSGRVILYYLVTYQHGLEGDNLNFIRGHWLDYCPEKRSIDCDW